MKPHSQKDKPGTPCPPPVFHALTRLHHVLSKHYGADFAYTIAAKGYVLSASNYVDGRRLPVRAKP